MDHRKSFYQCPNCGQPCAVQELKGESNFYRRSLCCQVAPLLIVRELPVPQPLKGAA